MSKPLPKKNILKLLPKNAGTHNGIYRGKDISNLFYSGALSKQISAGTFDDIFIGDYIIGKQSKRKYLVADLDYRLHCGDTECTQHHVLMIPERTMGNASMNANNITTGAYVGSDMYTKNLETYRTIIKNDFGAEHILKHREYFQNAVTNGYASGSEWIDSEIDLMNEPMVYGSYIFAPKTHHSEGVNTTIPNLYTIDKSQLSLFRLKPDSIIALNDAGARHWYWLRDVIAASYFAYMLGAGGNSAFGSASLAGGVRPAFLVI